VGLKDIAGIFSRFFVVGFFLPAFFSFLLLDRTLSSALLPDSYEAYTDGTRILVLGGAALLAGLVLSGLNSPVLRLFEGYPLRRARDLPGFGHVYESLMRAREREFDAQVSIREQPTRSPARTEAAQRLARSYPSKREELLPTRLGNVIRSFERHPRSRYGLDGVVVWPRIETFLAQEEHDLLSAAKADVAFFLNGAICLTAAAVALVAGAAATWGWGQLGVAAASLAVATLLYRASVGAAYRWGVEVRSIFDVHRLELYERMGLRRPGRELRESDVARTLNRWLLYGEEPGVELRAKRGDDEENAGSYGSSGAWSKRA